MALEAGSVFVRIAGLFDRTKIDEADRVIAKQREDAKKPIEYKIGAKDPTLAKDMADARAKADAATAKPVNFRVGVDDTGVAAKLAAVKAELAAISGSSAGGGALPPLRLHAADRKLLSDFMGSRGGGGGGAGSDVASAAEGGSGGGLGGALGFVGHLLHQPGGFRGMGGLSFGSLLGLGPEHAITAGLSMAGTAGPALAGAGLAMGGAAGVEAIGGGSDALVMHTTAAAAKTLGTAMDALQMAQVRYGKSSTQAAAATATLNAQVQNLVANGMSPAAAKAVEKMASDKQTMETNYYKDTSQATIGAAGIKEQLYGLADKVMPEIGAAAARNFGILSNAIKPLFTWLSGPQGTKIFSDLENDFAKKLPGSIDTATQAIEWLLKLIDAAASHGGGLSKKIDEFFTKQNAKSAETLGSEVEKLLGKMHMFGALLTALVRVITGVFKQSAGEGDSLVVSLTHVLDKMAAWERSAAGASTLKTFFKRHAEELTAILHTMGPVLKSFFQFYIALQSLMPVVTGFFNVLGDILGAISKLGQHSTLFRDMFIVPLGAFLLAWKSFGWEKSIGMVGKLATAVGLLNKATAEGGTKFGLFNKAASGLAPAVGKIPLIGGFLSKGLGKFGGAADTVLKNGGLTGMGPAGTLSNPMVTVSKAGDKTSLGSQSSDVENAKTAETDVAKAGASGAGVTSESKVASKVRALTGGVAPEVAALAPEAAPAALPEVAAGAGGGALASIGAALAPITAVVAAIVGLAAVTGNLGKLKDAVITPFANAWGSIKKAVEPIGTAFKNLVLTIENLFGKGDGKTHFMQGLGIEVKGIIVVIGLLITTISGALVIAVKTLVTIVVDVVNQIKTQINHIKEVFVGVFDVVKGIITLNGPLILKGFKSIGEGILGGLKSAFEFIPKLLWDVFKTMVNGVLSFLGISSPSSVFMSIGKSIADGLLSAVESLPGDFLNLGKMIISSMINGVESLAGDLWSAITAPIKSLLNDSPAVKKTASTTTGRFATGRERGGDLAGGGQVPGREYGLGDHMTLVDPSGRARARMAGDESVYTRWQRPEVDRGLQAIGYARGSQDLWATNTRPHGYAGGGQLKAKKPPTLATTLKQFGAGAFADIDREFGSLENQYGMQSNVFTLFNGSAPLSTKQLNTLMGIREHQWDLLWKEWGSLPAALKALNVLTFGATAKDGTRSGGIAQQVHSMSSGVSHQQSLITGVQNQQNTMASQAAMTGTGGTASGASVTSASTVASQMDALNARIASDTQQINALQNNPTTAPTNPVFNFAQGGSPAETGQTVDALRANYLAGQTSHAVGSAVSDTSTQAQLARLMADRTASQAAIARLRTQSGASMSPAAIVAAAVAGPQPQQTAANTNAAAMTSVSDQLNTLHTKNTQITAQIAPLTSQLAGASGNNYAKIQGQIASLKAQRTANQAATIPLTTQLHNLTANGVNIAHATRAHQVALSQSLRKLQATLRGLSSALSKEVALEQKAKAAIGNLRTRMYGDSSGSGSVKDQLGTEGYNMMDLHQQGAGISMRYVRQIDDIFKQLGIKLPKDWEHGGSADKYNSPAAIAAQQLASFQGGLETTLGSFGSNFVAAGANPFGSSTKLMAGVHNYGAAAGAGHERGGPLGTPYGGSGAPTGGSGDTTVHITQHFAGPPPDAHSYSNGLKWEIGAAL